MITNKQIQRISKKDSILSQIIAIEKLKRKHRTNCISDQCFLT